MGGTLRQPRLAPRVELALCAILRDEAAHVAEWLAFHRLVGVERFHLYVDDCADDTWFRLADQPDVVRVDWSEPARRAPWATPRCAHGGTPQVTAYNHFLATHGAECRWCAFLDGDEFLYHTALDDLRRALRPYRCRAGLFVSWLFFGSNGHVAPPADLTLAAYTRRGEPGEPFPTGWQGKLVAQPRYLLRFGPHGSHNAAWRDGFLPVNSDGAPVPGPAYRPCLDQFRVNHYYHRSAAEARRKAARVDRNAGEPQYQPTPARLAAHDLNRVVDRDILRFLPRLRRALATGVPPCVPR